MMGAATMTLGELLGPTAGRHAAVAFSDLALDSRQSAAGTAFVALRGSREHGLSHAADAMARGAVVVLYEPEGSDAATVPQPSVAVPRLRERLGDLANAFYWRSSPQPRLFGVTGTNGKSTVGYLVAQSMNRLGPSCGYVGTLGWGVPPRLRSHELTTPDCLTLHRELRDLKSECVAMEVSSHALAQDRVAGLVFQVAAFTNLSRDHLDAHGDLASYGRVKSRLFERPELTCAVLNLDDPFAATVRDALPPSTLCLGVTLRADPSAAVSGRIVRSSLAGLELEIEAGGNESCRLVSPLVGDFNAENILVSLGALVAWDFRLQQACDALSACSAPPGRMELLGAGPRQPAVVVDYAHTPGALARALESLRGLSNGELWCVFGCGGERDAGKRAEMGSVVSRLADHIVVTDDNPRGEDPDAIVAAIRAGIGDCAALVVERDRALAITRAVGRAASRDIVLIAGKGHESWQQVGDERRPFSDRQVAVEALGARA
jgi:UDP-N-acetylmuramoyl-L-alanyl-D-glutamate--2,6-diaminopimelate ligase